MTPVRRLALLAALALALIAGAAGAASAAPTSIPIAVLNSRTGHQVLVVAPVRIDRHFYLMILDTGASSTLIDRGIARKLHLRKAGRSQHAAGVFGRGRVAPVRVTSWQLGPLALPRAKIFATGLGVQRLGRFKLVGLLGSDILSRFGRVLIDYSAQVLTVGS